MACLRGAELFALDYFDSTAYLAQSPQFYKQMAIAAGLSEPASTIPTPQLTDDDVQRIVETKAKRVVRLLQRRGVLEEGNVDPLWAAEPLLATITAASVQGRIATGERAGQRVRRRLVDPSGLQLNSA